MIRRAGPDDGRAIADLFLRSRTASVPAIPPIAHAEDDVRQHFGTIVFERCEVWVAVDDAADVIAFIALDGDWVDHLYVDPSWSSRGIGTELVAVAKHQRPAGLQLWAFQTNTGARRFYERHGFVAVEFTDGHANEERAPDVRYVWRTPPPA